MGAATAVVTFPYLAPPAAAAQVRGPCTATLNGISADDAATPDRAIEVDYSDRVQASGTMSSGPVSYRVELEWGGFSWTVKESTTQDSSWSDTVDVAEYAKYGVGLYKVNAFSSNGVEQCTAEGYVNVVGKNPLTTVAGAAGAVAFGAGALALGGATAAAATKEPPHADYDVSRSEEEWQRSLPPWWAEFCPVYTFAAVFLTLGVLWHDAHPEEELA